VPRSIARGVQSGATAKATIGPSSKSIITRLNPTTVRIVATVE
jgi:hypothetical protein